MDPWLKLKFPKHSEIRIRTFVRVFSVWKISSFTERWNGHKQISTLWKIIDYSKVVSFMFKVLYYGHMGKTQVSNTSRNENLDFLWVYLAYENIVFHLHKELS